MKLLAKWTHSDFIMIFIILMQAFIQTYIFGMEQHWIEAVVNKNVLKASGYTGDAYREQRTSGTCQKRYC